MSNLPLNNNQSILNSWNKDKTDKGLTLKELKDAADINKDNKISVSELKSKGITDKEAQRISKITDSLNIADKFLAKVNLKDDFDKFKDKTVILNLFELDDKALPEGVSGVSISDIQQGDRPTCYMLGAVASMAQQRPDDILKLVEKNKDGTYTVTFPGLPKEKKVNVMNPIMPLIPVSSYTTTNNNKITVSPPTQEELKKYTHKGLNNSTWVAIIDKAYNKYCQENGLKANYIPFFPKDKASDYGMPWEGVEALTGNKTEHFMVDFTRDKKILDKIETGLKNKKVIVACTIGKGDTKPKEGELRISNAHVYSITGVNKQKNTITVRDPYGDEDRIINGKKVTDKSKDGFLELTMDQFNKYFTDIVIEKSEKL